MAKTMMINGETFEVVTPKTSNVEWYDRYLKKSETTIHDCYGRPSQRKLNIYAWWRCWFAELFRDENITDYHFAGVTSYNCNFFTLGGTITIYDTEYIISITASHNRLIKVVR